MAQDMGKVKVKLYIELKKFERNMKKFERESEEEFEKIFESGAATFATMLATRTPPSMGKVDIAPQYYQDGVMYDASTARKPGGRRRIFDLMALARNPDTGHYRSYYGRLLRAGYKYATYIKRRKRPGRLRPVKTLFEAKSHAQEKYRGISRAAWGLSLVPSVASTVPKAFQKYIERRPAIAQMTPLNTVQLVREKKMKFVTTNRSDFLDPAFLPYAEPPAQKAAFTAMNKKFEAFFKKKVKL